VKRLLVFITCVAIACSERPAKEAPANRADSSPATLKYAQGFKISSAGAGKLVEVTYPYQGAGSSYKYLLLSKADAVPAHDERTKVIRVPIATIVCTSTTHIPLLDYLDETQALVGFPTTDYISSEKMRKRIDEGNVTELGVDKGINLERLAVLKPDLVMGYLMTADYGQFKKMEELGIPVVINAEYLEKHPLGRAEWIKFMALFFNKEKQADSVFREIEKSYLSVKAMTDSIGNRPTVMSGIVYGDSWFLPGGQNYASRIIDDAGCDYLWRDNQSNGYLQLSFEKVYEKANDADFWIGTGQFSDLTSLKNADHRYARFKPFTTGEVYSSDASHGAKGGSQFLELGYLRPDIILKDLVKIAHPELLPDHQLFFHKKLDN
jgi:iron complex transport system substrate-binding protein